MHGFAVDVWTVLASSAGCERLFSGTGNILEPQRRKIGSQLLAALVCVQRWTRAGFKAPSATHAATYADDELIKEFGIDKWERPTVRRYFRNPPFVVTVCQSLEH